VRTATCEAFIEGSGALSRTPSWAVGALAFKRRVEQLGVDGRRAPARRSSVESPEQWLSQAREATLHEESTQRRHGCAPSLITLTGQESGSSPISFTAALAPPPSRRPTPVGRAAELLPRHDELSAKGARASAGPSIARWRIAVCTWARTPLRSECRD